MRMLERDERPVGILERLCLGLAVGLAALGAGVPGAVLLLLAGAVAWLRGVPRDRPTPAPEPVPGPEAPDLPGAERGLVAAHLDDWLAVARQPAREPEPPPAEKATAGSAEAPVEGAGAGAGVRPGCGGPPPAPSPETLQVRVYCQDHRMGVQTTGLVPLEVRRPTARAPQELWFMASTN